MEGTSKILVPRIDTTAAWVPVDEEPLETRLLGAVARVLGHEVQKVQLMDSFEDLGGDQRTAMALRKECAKVGMSARTKDILGCRTMAELLTHITPCARQDDSPPVESVMIAPLEIYKASGLSVHEKSSHIRHTSESSTGSQSNPYGEVEEILNASKLVSRAAVIKPKAGPLEGKLVAFLALVGSASSAELVQEVSIVSTAQDCFAGTQISALKASAAASLAPALVPSVWIPLDGIPRTETGLTDRRLLRTWAQNMNEALYSRVTNLETVETLQAPGSEMERSLQRLVSKVLRVQPEQVGVNFTFTQLGGDEMSAMELVARCKHESITLNQNELLHDYSIADLALIAGQRGGLAHKWSEENLDAFELSPMQQLYFQTPMGCLDDRRQLNNGYYRFNQSLLLRAKKQYALEDIFAAVEAVVGHHPMLRSRFTPTTKGWTQRILPEVDGSYAFHHHAVRFDEEVEAVMEATQASINIEYGPVFAVDYFWTNDGQQIIYIVAHHLAVDLASWRVVIHDLDELLENGSFLSQRSMPFQKWVELQKAEVQRPDANLDLPFATTAGDCAYWGLEQSPGTYGDAVEASFSLSAETTTILQSSCSQVFRTDSAEIYLAALMLSFAQTFPDRAVPVVWNQEHGREPWSSDLDISDTVGWFTSLCPISQAVSSSVDFVDVLRQLKDLRRSVPDRGAQYFASRFFNAAVGDIFNDWPFEIIFSYGGSVQQLERENGVLEQVAIPGRTLGSKTSDIGPSVGRIALFEVSAMVDQGQAKVKFLYSRYSRDQERIQRWIQTFESVLVDGVGKLRHHEQELTLADVPYLDVTYANLDTLNKNRAAALNLTSVRDIEHVYPVTANQQNILISQAQRPETGYLHTVHEFSAADGELVDIARLCSAWERVNFRHAVLRTVFIDSVTETGLFDQVVLRKSSPDMLFIDVVPPEDPVEELNSLPNPKPDSTKPAHRLVVCRCPTKVFVKLDISEAICDAIGIHILIADLKRAYVTEKAIPNSGLFSFPIFLDYLKAVRQESSLRYWRDLLFQTQPCLFPRLTVKPDLPKLTNLTIRPEVSASAVINFARTQNVTIDSVLRLAWGLVLRSVTSSNSIVFGYRTNGRNGAVAGLAHAVGPFSNVVTCTADLASESPLPALLKTFEAQLEESLLHQHITIEEIHHGLGINGSEKLFNSCLSFTEAPTDLITKYTTRTNLELKPMSQQDALDFDVSINARFIDDQLAIDIGYRIMSSEQATSIAQTFGKAVQAIVQNASGTVGATSLFSDRDYAQIVAWGSDASAGEARAKVVLHHLISEKALVNPDATAICALDGELTYAELEDISTKLAYHLMSSGVGPNSVVPVVLEKSRWAPVAMVAVLKAGGAFVPIDSEEMELIQPIAAELDAKLAIATGNAATALTGLFDVVVTMTDELMAQLPDSQGAIPAIATAEDNACVLFMHGSTKQVRGISFTHSALTTAFIAQGRAARISFRSRVMQLSSFHLDIALFEIFTTLVHGGCVCMPSSVERLNDFTGAVNRMSVNWTYMTPMLSRKLDPALMPTLKAVCFRTRSLDEDTYTPWFGKVNVIVAYGAPDICPLGVSFLEVIGPYHLKSIAQPFAGSFWVVNPEDHRSLVAVGAVGELVVEGPTLGAQYPPTDTATSPVEGTRIDPERKTRYYKTRHRVRYTEGGLLEFVSSDREDFEINGKRIDLIEVEQHLRRCLGRGVDVMVEAIAFRTVKSVPLLAAFVELGNGLFDGSESLTKLSPVTKEKAYIAKQLVETGLRNTIPEYMIPTAFIPVKHLPITQSLKVNRRRLQKMIQGLSREQLLSLAAVANPSEVQSISLKPLPLTQNEEKMRTLWARVLGIDENLISAADTFFRKGGDDILAARLAVVCRHSGVSIAVADIMKNVSLTELCRSMLTAEESQATPQSSPNPAQTTVTRKKTINEAVLCKVIAPKIGVERSAIKDIVEATSMQIRYIESGMLRGRAGIDYFVFEFTGSVNAKKLEEACQMVTTIHPILRTAFVPYKRKVYQVVLKSTDIDFKKQLAPHWRLASVVDKIIKKDQISPVAFASPMTKFWLCDSGKQATLVMRLAKAQYDDLSIALLVKDLKRLYDGAENPPRRPSYCDFVRSAQLANRQGAEDYWKVFLDGASMTQIVKHSKPYFTTTKIETLRQTVPVTPLSNLGITFATVLKAAWAMVLARFAGSSDVVFGELIDGRHVRLNGNHSVTGVMGPTTNAIPVRVCFPDHELSPLALLQYVHGQRISSIPFETYGFLDIVERCTSWAYWTRLSTVVQHQSSDAAITPTDSKTFHLGSTPCKFHIVEPKAQDICDLFVRSVAKSSGQVELSMTFCSERVPSTFAEQALRSLAETIDLLTSVGIMQPIVPGAFEYRNMKKTIPIHKPSVPRSPSPTSSGPSQPSTSLDITSPFQQHQLSAQMPAEHVRVIQAIINKGWASIINPRALGVPEEQIHNASFFDLWGSLMPAAQLASYFSRELPKTGIAGLEAGMFIYMEDIIEHPTMLKQFEMIVKKMSATHSTGPSVPPKEAEKKVAIPARAATIAPPKTNSFALVSARRRPTVVVSATASKMGKSIRRLASTVTRQAAPVTIVKAPPASAVPAMSTPLVTVLPDNTISPLSPDAPLGITVSHEAPQLPNLPRLSPFREEDEEEAMAPAAAIMPEKTYAVATTIERAASDGSRSGSSGSGASLTNGSSAESGDEQMRTNTPAEPSARPPPMEAHPIFHSVSSTAVFQLPLDSPQSETQMQMEAGFRKTWGPVLKTNNASRMPVMVIPGEGGEHDMVSPLSATSRSVHFFDPVSATAVAPPNGGFTGMHGLAVVPEGEVVVLVEPQAEPSEIPPPEVPARRRRGSAAGLLARVGVL